MTKVTDTDGLFKFTPLQWQFDAMTAAGIAKNVPTQATVMTAFRDSEGCIAMRALGPVLVRNFLDSKV
jgi:hypothetical protein